MNTDTPTPRTDEFEALRDAMSTRASADYVAALQLCDELERELTAVTEQRDRLAEALRELLTTGDNGYGTPTDKAWEMAEQAIAAVEGGKP
jgi:MoxR-like ATPase